MTAYIFAGPTIAADDGRAELDAIFLPPAAQGDVYRASLERPVAIGIIDGYFERVPSVSHKEVLWAMSQGVHVFGSASMGALRAAELAAFGMEGVGAVYEALRSGEIEDEDEVAVAHAPAEDGYRAVSEAMVNIRATLRAAELRGVIGPAARAAFERAAKGLFYPDRSYPAVLARAAASGVEAAQVESLRAFLRSGRVDQKREDAIAMLRLMRERIAGGLPPKRVHYHFEHTDAWEFIRKNAAGAPSAAVAGGGAPPAVLEELRLAGRYRAALRGAIARALSVEVAGSYGRTAKGGAALAAAEELRREQGLLRPEDFQRWLEENEVEDVERFFMDEAQVRWVETTFAADAARVLADHLRSAGDYASILARARDKERVLAAEERAGGGRSQVSDEELYRWYFEERLGRPVPPALGRYARSAGFADLDTLRAAASRELVYVRALERRAPASTGAPTASSPPPPSRSPGRAPSG